MKKLSRFLILALCAALCLGMLAGCAKTTDSTTEPAPAEQPTEQPAAETPAAEEPAAEEPAAEEPAEEVHLEIWFSDVLGTEKDLPESEWTINKYARAFEAENPGVTIDVIYQADQGMVQNKLKASVSSGTAPDIVNIFGGYMVTYYKDILTDITSYIPQDDLDNITGWETVSEGLKEGAPIYGYPEAGNELGLFVYNKALAAQAGIDLEGDGAPKNAEEFKQLLHDVQDQGITPILAKDGGANSLFTFATGAWWTQMSGTDRIVSDSMAETSFADDQGFIDTLNFAASLYAEGLVNEDYNNNQDAKNRFYNGECLMYPTGNWEIPTAREALGDDLGIYCVPSFDGKVEAKQFGGVGQAWAVLSTCEHPDIAVKFLSFISQKDYVITQVQASGKAPQRKDVTAEDLGWAGDPVYEKVLDYCKNVVIWNDNAMQSDVANEYYTRSGMVIIGQITAEECAEQLDEIARDAAE